MHRLTAAVRRRTAEGTDQGIAMVMVMGVMLVVTAVAVGALAFAANVIPSSRHSEDYQIAGAAAQAGVDDFLGRLASCDTYWKSPCGNSAPDNTTDPYDSKNPTKWLDGVNFVKVPDTSSGVRSTSYYTYKILSAPSATSKLRLEVKGRSGSVTRVFTTDLGKSSLLNYIYYTDLEDLDPLLYSVNDKGGVWCGSSLSPQNYIGTGTCNPQYPYYTMDDPSATPTDLAALRATCGVQSNGTESYYYSVSATRDSLRWDWSGTYTSKANNGKVTTQNITVQMPCTDIQFVTGDTIRGPMHTNDGMDINGGKFADADTETAWGPGDPAQPANAGKYWYNGNPDLSANPQGYAPTSTDPINLPPTNASIRQQADPVYGGQGCMYTGPTKITLLPGGKMTVVSPYTKAANKGCYTTLPITSAQTVSAPVNGVIYVQGIPTNSADPNYTSSCTMTTEINALGYPNVNDVGAQPTSTTQDGKFGCDDGTAFVSGTGFGGNYTIATANDVYATGSLTYANASPGGDILGLVANGFVYVYHPVTSSGTNLAGSLTNPELDAAILSVSDSFVVENWNLGAQLGSLKVVGGIYQRYRGPVGTGGGNCASGTGYCKNYNYDTRLPITPPPFYLDPVNAAWRVQNEAEQAGNNS